MPRNVRNFWVSLAIDGRKEEVATGPRRGDGGIEILVEIREEGYISKKRLRIDGSCVDGQLTLDVRGMDGENTVFQQQLTTKR
jgi:hypothetical protein